MTDRMVLAEAAVREMRRDPRFEGSDLIVFVLHRDDAPGESGVYGTVTEQRGLAVLERAVERMRTPPCFDALRAEEATDGPPKWAK